MFTGLIQTLGSVAQLSPSRLKVICPDLLTALELGDSIAVDGLCLTVAEILMDGFIADLSPETLHRSSLGIRNLAQPVNLEASLRAGDKIGGHFVSGHVDGVGTVAAVNSTGSAWELAFQVPDPVARYIVEKGSVAINGISLTVATLQDQGRWFQVAVIPHTYHSTNLSHLEVGDPVNIEADMLGKYVEKLMGWHTGGSVQTPDSISLEFLVEHGYA